MTTQHATQLIPLDRLHPAPWNANRMTRAMTSKVRKSMEEFGIVENLVARPHPRPCPICGADDDHFEVVSGNHRLELHADVGLAEASVAIVELDDGRARLLAEVLNGTRGTNDPELYAANLERILQDLNAAEISDYLPESEASIRRLVKHEQDRDPNASMFPPTGKPKSKAGVVYELGPHRLMCGNSTNPAHVAKLLDGAEPVLLVTDPPFGIDLNEVFKTDPKKYGKGGKGASPKVHAPYMPDGDTRVDWSECWELVPSLSVAYVWHAGARGAEVERGLDRIGFDVVQQLIWDKGRFVLGRQHYYWAHETAFYAAKVGREVPWYGPGHVPAFYARKRGVKAPWLGEPGQSTIWLVPSPRLAVSAENRAHGDEQADHPTQKPVELYTRPIVNHIRPGEAFYDSFGGSGTAIIAGELTGRRAYAMELMPAFCDVIRQRYADFTGRPELAP